MNVRSYPEYKDSGVEWVGGVPKSWRMASLRRIATIVNGGTPTPSEDNWGGDIAWATPVDLNKFDGKVIGPTLRTITVDGLRSGSSSVPAKSVLLSTRAPIGYVSMTEGEMAFNQGCKGLFSKADQAVPEFLMYSLLAGKAELVSRGQGTTFLELSTGALMDFAMPVPTLEEQQEIVAYLDQETAQIDAFIADQEELIGLLNERRAAAITQAVTKGLDLNVPMKDTGVEWLGWVPEAWRIQRLWTLFTREKNVGHPDEMMLSVFRDYGVIPKESRENFNKTAENRNIYQLVEPGWLVSNRMKAWQGSVGISSYRGIVSGHYICFRPVHNELDDYLNSLFRSDPYAAGYRSISRGVRIGQAEIDNDEYKLLPVLLPPVAEQRRITAYLERENAEIEAAIEDAQKSIDLSKERRAAVISAAVTGKIDVRDHSTTNQAINQGEPVGVA